MPAQSPPGYLPGFEIGYDQITAGVTIASTSISTPTTIITCAAHAFDGGPVMVEFFSAFVGLPNSGTPGINYVGITLAEGGTTLNEIAFLRFMGIASPPSQPYGPTVGRWRFTPSAGLHSYVVGGYAGSTSGTPAVGAGTGLSAGDVPAFVRFTKV